jgi:ABC-type antimicrobial peptide transport system permease subunit
MTSFRFILRSLLYFRKHWLAILGATTISTAVLTGALLVGDSVRYSLSQMAVQRLGSVDFALVSGDQCFRQLLAKEINNQLCTPVIPVMQLDGIAINNENGSRIPSVHVIGIDSLFPTLFGEKVFTLRDNEAVVSRNTARRMNLNPGDHFILRIDNITPAPQNAPFISIELPSVSLQLNVYDITEDFQMGRFSLNSNQVSPYNVFVNLHSLSARLKLSGLANTLLVAGTNSGNITAETLQQTLQTTWKPGDIGLILRSTQNPGEFEFTSDRIFLDKSLTEAIKKEIPKVKPVLTYLVNSISAHGRLTPYSFVTASVESFDRPEISEQEIVVNRWLAVDLGLKTGDSVRLTWFVVGPLHTLKEDSAMFRIISVIPEEGKFAGPQLMPRFPGISQAWNCRDWKAGVPIDLKRIRKKDEEYWNEYRGTPKAFISLETGQTLWQNPFGNLTAIRFSHLETDTATLMSRIMNRLNPASQKLLFEPIRQKGLQAAHGSNNFGELFLSLSFFIIVSGLLLTGLAYALFLKNRLPEAAVMVSAGFKKASVIRYLAGEAMAVASVGGLTGVVTGILFCHLLLYGLNTLWVDAIRTTGLVIELRFSTILTGYFIGLLVSSLVFLFLLRLNLKRPLIPLIRSSGAPAPIRKTGKTTATWISVIFIGSATILISVRILSGHFEETSLFLAFGGMLLTGIIAGWYYLLSGMSYRSDHLPPGFLRMVSRNLSLYRRRSLSAISLLALGTFTIIITGANLKDETKSIHERKSGTGGFLFWAESTLPVMEDLNTSDGMKATALDDEPSLADVTFLQMYRLEGDDASCMNLNRVLRPNLLGINPVKLDRIGAFSFVNLDPSINPDHPWTGLIRDCGKGIIPAFADQSVITWGLGKKIGDTVVYYDESGNPLYLKLVGGLENSLFQGSILIADSLFQIFFPSVRGSNVMLVDGPATAAQNIRDRLETLFIDFGMVVSLAADKLAAFQSVQNTYLSVFMILGGLGILIGTIGFGFLILRNILERRTELALMSAIGFRRKDIFRMLLAENFLILLAGMSTGLIAAFAGIIPELFSPEYQIPFLFLTGVLLVIGISSFFWIWFPARNILKKNLIRILQEE